MLMGEREKEKVGGGRGLIKFRFNLFTILDKKELIKSYQFTLIRLYIYIIFWDEGVAEMVGMGGKTLRFF